MSLVISIVLSGQGYLSQKFSPNARVFSASKGSALPTGQKSLLKVKAIAQKSYVDVFLRLKNSEELDSLLATGVIVNSRIGNIVTAMVPVDSMARLGRVSNVRRVEVGTPVFLNMDKARYAANVDSVALGKGLDQPYKGKGVVIGIVDNGFQYGHVNFYNSTLDSLRVKRVWNQNSSAGVKPAKYGYGSEYKTSAAILGAAYDNTTELHGTHVAGIAAGSDQKNNYSGVAPEADLIFVSYSSSSNTGVLDGIKYVYDYASEVSEPAVVNLSLGSHIGPHDGTSIFDQACDALQGPGRLLVGAAGNEGAIPVHIKKTFASSADTLKTLFAYTDTTVQVVASDIWSGANQNFRIAVGIYDTSTQKYLYKSRFIDANTVDSIDYEISYNKFTPKAINGYVYVATEKNADNSKANAYIQSELNNMTSSQHVCVFITSSSGYVDAWSLENYCLFNPAKISGWTVGGTASSIGEIGGTGNNIISVGSYSTKNKFTNISNQSFSVPSLVVGTISSFSSKGPTGDGRIKPDIAAPGALIASSFSEAVANTSEYSSQRVAQTPFNGNTYYYGVMQGTSMASPFVAGVLATWLQANPLLAPADIRTLFRQTAINDAYTGSVRTAGSNIWGFGKIDAWAGIKKIIATSGIEHSTKPDMANGLFSLNQQGKTITLNFFQDVDDVVVSVYSLTGKEVYRNAIGNMKQYEESSLILGGLQKGIYILHVAGKNSSSNNRKIIL